MAIYIVVDSSGAQYYADSKEEYWFSLALWAEKLPFDFQVPIDGGTWRPGGYVLDFLVYTPLPVAVPVQGDYWHKSELDPKERFNMSRLERLYGAANVMPIWGSEMPDYEAVLAWVKRELK